MAGARSHSGQTGLDNPKPSLASRKPQAPIRATNVKAQGRTTRTARFSVTDGRTTIGHVVCHDDPHNGVRFTACDVNGKILGVYSTKDAAIARLPAPKEKP
jgi:hypothetical protein